MDATGVAYEARALRPGRRPLPRHGRGAARRGPRGAAGPGRDPARRRRHARCPAGGPRAGPAPRDAVRARPLRESTSRSLRPPSELNDGVDMVVVRENTEGTYAGEGGFLRKDTPHEIATQGSVNTRMGVERCVRFAFDLARSRPAHRLTLVHKTNVLTFAGDLWQRTFDAVARRIPRGRHRLRPRRCGVHPFRPAPGALRRHRHRQPLRRHPDRPRWRGRGWDRPGRLGQPQPRPDRPLAVRAGPRLRSRHRGHRHRRPPCRGHQRGDDAGVPRGDGRGGADPGGRAIIGRRDRVHLRRRLTSRGKGVAMPIEATEKIWMNGELVPWADARIHVLTHSLHYGMGVFEGIRAYETDRGPAVFRLTDHIERLFNSAQDPDDGYPVHGRRVGPGDQGHRPVDRVCPAATSGRSPTTATARWD